MQIKIHTKVNNQLNSLLVSPVGLPIGLMEDIVKPSNVHHSILQLKLPLVLYTIDLDKCINAQHDAMIAVPYSQKFSLDKNFANPS